MNGATDSRLGDCWWNEVDYIMCCPKEFPQDSGGIEVCLERSGKTVQRWEVWANDIVKASDHPRHSSRRHPSSADPGRPFELRSFPLSDHVVPRRFTGLERDSGNIGLHSNATRGGRASQGQRRKGLREEGLWQAAEEANRRYDRQDLLRMRQAGIPREGLLEPTGVV